MKKYLKIIACTAFIMFVLFNTWVFADVGNINRYDSNTSSNNDSNEFYITDLIMLFIGNPILIVIVVVIVLVIYFKMKKAGKVKNASDAFSKVKESYNNISSKYSDILNGNIAENISNKISGEMVANQIKEIDPAFSEEAFLSWAKNVFVKIQEAWTTRNWKVIRPFESNELFEQHSMQLQEYINNGKINVIEKVNIKSCKLIGFKPEGDKEILNVELSAIMRDYVIDEKTKKVLESDPNTDWNMSYIMTFIRKAGVKTVVGTSNKSTTNCPNCGAPTEITSAGQCEYCGSIITTGEHDFVLSDIKKK